MMNIETINMLRGLAYEYCNEDEHRYVEGTTLYSKKLNKGNFEKLSAFVNWIEVSQRITQAPLTKKVYRAKQTTNR